VPSARRLQCTVAAALVLGAAESYAGDPASPHRSTAAADATVTSQPATARLGKATTLLVAGKPRRRAYLTFDLGSATSSASKATLRLYVRQTRNDPRLTLQRVLPEWDETAISWADAPPPSGPRVRTARVRSKGWLEVDVTPLLGESDQLSFVGTVGGSGKLTFGSREGGGARAPQLLVYPGANGHGPNPPSSPKPSPKPPPAGDPGSGAAAGAQIGSVSIVGSAVKVRPNDDPPGATEARIFAARNEFESFQVVVAAHKKTLRGLSVTLDSPLVDESGRTIPDGNVTIYRQGYYDVGQRSDDEGAPGLWPDPLIPSVDPIFGEPRNAFPIDVPAGENRAAWIDVQVPANAVPGVYRGALGVRALELETRVPVTVTVLNFTLPSTASLRTSFGMDWASACEAVYGDNCFAGHYEEGWRLKSLYVRSALDNRVTISSPHYEPPASTFEESHFKRFSLPYLSGTGQTRLPGAQLTSLNLGTRFLKNWRALAQANSFADRAFVPPCDEPHTAPEWATCQTVAQSVRAAWPDVTVLLTSSIQRVRQWDAESWVDTIVPTVQQLENKPPAQPTANQRPVYDSFLTPGNNLWWYTSCDSTGDCSGDPGQGSYYNGWPGYAIDQSASQSRSLPWLSFVYGISGELYWSVDHKLLTAWTDQYAFGTNGDGTLFYPGLPSRIGGSQPIPIESLRLKLIRDGLEDYEYLLHLARNGAAAKAREIAASLFPKTYEAARSDAEVQAARRQLGALVASISGGPTP
jgi:hypothetical protein